MEKSFYHANTPEEAMEIYLQNENELYARIKNNIIKKILGDLYNANSWSYLKVLEIGGGGGIWTNFFLEKGSDVTCVDISEQILKANEKSHPQARFVLADAATLKLDERFDLVFAKDVIEHIKDDERFLRNMDYHLKDSGLIVINTQNSWSLNYLIQGGYHFLKGDKNWCGWDPTHVRFYNVKSLKRKLKNAGFKPIKWFGSYYFPYRIISGRLGINEAILRPFCFPELLGLYDKILFSIIGWGIGVCAGKN
jgi:2-polyprenyl-6-hydroxyphenyl methylase/3-demethylubiquinone-9 3-methyltransferase